MPISAEQWRSVVGSNSIKRPRQIGPKGCFDKARGRSRCGNKQLSADETTFSVASLIHGLSAPSYIGVVFGLLWLWSYQYTDTRVLMEPGDVTQGIGLMSNVATLLLIGILVPGLDSFMSTFSLSMLLLLLAGDVETNPGPVDLTLDDLCEVNDALLDITSKWYMIGLQLRINPGVLDIIEKKCPNDPSKGLLEVLKEWLKSGEASWEKLITVLENRALGETSVARKLKDKYSSDKSENLLGLPVTPEVVPDYDSAEGELDKTCIAEYAEVLKANYQKQSLPAEGLLEHSSKICRLAMIQREKLRRHEINNEFVQQTITGKVDDILHMKTPVELKSIFKGVPSDRKVVLIEGAPGAGKSSLSLNICKKWSDGDLFQEYTAVILVRLRDPCIQAATLIAELLPHCEKGVSKKVGSVILATEGENILWVLDGWDEFPEHLKKDEKCLVRNLIYQQSHSSSVIVTSRPISSVALHSLVSKRIEILGFTVDELQQYFEYRLKGDTKSVEILLQKIKEYPEVHSSCYLPLHAGFIADTFLMNKQDLPGTQYGIFETVVMKCISRHQIKQGKEEITSLVNVESVIKENIVAICKLAYKGILENKIIFTNQDLPISGFKSLDLLQEVESMVVFQGRVSRTYNFLHLSIQEFLAAQELARRPKHEQYWLFRGLMEDDRCLPMLTFYAAKTKLTAPGIANFVSTVGDRYLQATKEHEREQLCGLLAFVFKCICETEDPSLCKPLVKALDGQFFGISHIYDYYSLGSFLSLSSCAPSGCDNRIMIGDIERSVIQNHEWALFLKGLLRFYKGKCVSVLETGDLTVRSSDPILDLLKHMQLSIRHLYIWDGYVRRISKRKSLHNSLDVSTPWLIADLLKSDNIVSSLKVRGIKVSHEFIAEGLRLNTRLRELHLVQCNITSLGLQFLCEGLYRNMSLRILDLSNNPLADGVECLSDMFKRNTTLDDLNLNNCQLNSHHLSTIKSFGNLKVLSLSCNGIGNKGAKYLTKALDVNRTLQMLVVTKCGITAHGSTSLLNVFQNGSLHTLKTMHIDSAVEETMPELPSFYSGYQVYPGRSSQFHSATTSTFNEKSLIQVTINLNGGMILSRLIKHGYPLQTLVISSKDVDFDVLNSIFEVLKYNTNLKYFQVVNGGMNGLNFKTIAESLKENKTLLTVMLDNDLRDYNTGYRNTWRRQTDNMSAISNLLQYVAECFRFNHTLQFLRIPPQCDNHVFKQLLYRCMYRGSVKLLHNQNDFEQSFSHGYEDLISDTVSI